MFTVDSSINTSNVDLYDIRGVIGGGSNYVTPIPSRQGTQAYAMPSLFSDGLKIEMGYSGVVTGYWLTIYYTKK